MENEARLANAARTHPDLAACIGASATAGGGRLPDILALLHYHILQLRVVGSSSHLPDLESPSLSLSLVSIESLHRLHHRGDWGNLMPYPWSKVARIASPSTIGAHPRPAKCWQDPQGEPIPLFRARHLEAPPRHPEVRSKHNRFICKYHLSLCPRNTPDPTIVDQRPVKFVGSERPNATTRGRPVATAHEQEQAVHI